MIRLDELGQRKDSSSDNSSVYKRGKADGLSVKTELQKAFKLPPGKIFKVCQRSSKCSKVGLSKLKIRRNLENQSLFFFQKEGMTSGVDHHLLFFSNFMGL